MAVDKELLAKQLSKNLLKASFLWKCGYGYLTGHRHDDGVYYLNTAITMASLGINFDPVEGSGITDWAFLFAEERAIAGEFTVLTKDVPAKILETFSEKVPDENTPIFLNLVKDAGTPNATVVNSVKVTVNIPTQFSFTYEQGMRLVLADSMIQTEESNFLWVNFKLDPIDVSEIVEKSMNLLDYPWDWANEMHPLIGSEFNGSYYINNLGDAEENGVFNLSFMPGMLGTSWTESLEAYEVSGEITVEDSALLVAPWAVSNTEKPEKLFLCLMGEGGICLDYIEIIPNVATRFNLFRGIDDTTKRVSLVLAGDAAGELIDSFSGVKVKITP